MVGSSNVFPSNFNDDVEDKLFDLAVYKVVKVFCVFSEIILPHDTRQKKIENEIIKMIEQFFIFFFFLYKLSFEKKKN